MPLHEITDAEVARRLTPSMRTAIAREIAAEVGMDTCRDVVTDFAEAAQVGMSGHQIAEALNRLRRGWVSAESQSAHFIRALDRFTPLAREAVAAGGSTPMPKEREVTSPVPPAPRGREEVRKAEAQALVDSIFPARPRTEGAWSELREMIEAALATRDREVADLRTQPDAARGAIQQLKDNESWAFAKGLKVGGEKNHALCNKALADHRDAIQRAQAQLDAVTRERDEALASRERVRIQLSNEMDRLVANVRVDYGEKLRAVDAKLTEATKALEWYGDRDSYDRPFSRGPDGHLHDYDSPADRDKGERARQALLRGGTGE